MSFMALGFFFGSRAEALTPLPVDQAFSFSLARPGVDRIEISFRVAEGHYLYKKRIRLSIGSPPKPIIPRFPKGQIKKDPFFGKVEIFRGSFSLMLPLPREFQGEKELLLTLIYQGCSDQGFCYPPQRQMMTLKDIPPLN